MIAPNINCLDPACGQFSPTTRQIPPGFAKMLAGPQDSCVPGIRLRPIGKHRLKIRKKDSQEMAERSRADVIGYWSVRLSVSAEEIQLLFEAKSKQMLPGDGQIAD